MKKFVIVYEADLPKKIPIRAKIKSIYRPETGIHMADLKWKTLNRCRIYFEWKEGSLRKGKAEVVHEGDMGCDVYSFYNRAISEYKVVLKGRKFAKNVYLVSVYSFTNHFAAELAARFVLKNRYGIKNIYGGFPLASIIHPL